MNIEEKVCLSVKKYQLKKTERATKTSPFGGIGAISTKPGQKSFPLCLVWSALLIILLFYVWYIQNKLEK